MNKVGEKFTQFFKKAIHEKRYRDLTLVIVPIIGNAIITFCIVNYQSFTDSAKELTKKKLSIVENLSRLDGKSPLIETYFDYVEKHYKNCEPKHSTDETAQISENCKRYFKYSEKLAEFNASMEAELFMLDIYSSNDTKLKLKEYMKDKSPFWKKDRDKLHEVIGSFAKGLD